ncbi:hypothetical protein [Pontibacter pudoricolor]
MCDRYYGYTHAVELVYNANGG